MTAKVSKKEWDRHTGFCPILHGETQCLCDFIKMVKQSERDRLLNHFAFLADELLALRDWSPSGALSLDYAWGRLDKLIRLLEETS